MKVRHQYRELENPFTDVFFERMLKETPSLLVLKSKILRYVSEALKSKGIGDPSGIDIGIYVERDIYFIHGKDFYSAMLLQGLYVPETYNDEVIVCDWDNYYYWDSRLHKCVPEDVGAHKIVIPAARLYAKPESPVKLEFIEKVKELL